MSNPSSTSSADLEAKLAALTAEVTAEFEAQDRAEARTRNTPLPAVVRRRRSFAMWITMVASIGLLVILPFAVLIGGAVWLYRVQAMPTWVAMHS